MRFNSKLVLVTLTVSAMFQVLNELSFPVVILTLSPKASDTTYIGKYRQCVAKHDISTQIKPQPLSLGNHHLHLKRHQTFHRLR